MLVESSNQYRQVTAVDVVVRESNNQIVGDMNDCSVSLESIKVRLRAWLDEKRNIFPRFYFLSDDEMLFVLSSNSRTTKDERPYKEVRSILPRIFHGISDLIVVEERAEEIAKEGDAPPSASLAAAAGA